MRAVGVEMLRTGGSALDAACAATMVLEDAGETNAGYGSNLTESGTVEMGELTIRSDKKNLSTVGSLFPDICGLPLLLFFWLKWAGYLAVEA